MIILKGGKTHLVNPKEQFVSKFMLRCGDSFWCCK